MYSVIGADDRQGMLVIRSFDLLAHGDLTESSETTTRRDGYLSSHGKSTILSGTAPLLHEGFQPRTRAAKKRSSAESLGPA